MKNIFKCLSIAVAILLISCDFNHPITPKDEYIGDPSDTLTPPVLKAFSVSKSNQVYFSPGNLQYHPKNNEWRFAYNQLNYVGKTNANIDPDYDGWIDLFAWGTGDNPTNLSVNPDDYQMFVDWGHNKIGEESANKWRTLTHEEWMFILKHRPRAEELSGVATVNGVNGMILLPDDWISPADISFAKGTHVYKGVGFYSLHQNFTTEQWSKLAASGAIFLPAAGVRSDKEVLAIQERGTYWSSSVDEAYDAHCILFESNIIGTIDIYRDTGRSVRLVRDI